MFAGCEHRPNLGRRKCAVSAGEPKDAPVPPQHAAPLRSGPPRVVHVARTPQVEAAREGLPIVGMEQEVMEAVNGSDVVLLCGETGCGKTTQASTETVCCHACCRILSACRARVTMPHDAFSCLRELPVARYANSGNDCRCCSVLPTQHLGGMHRYTTVTAHVNLFCMFPCCRCRSSCSRRATGRRRTRSAPA